MQDGETIKIANCVVLVKKSEWVKSSTWHNSISTIEEEVRMVKIFYLSN